MLLYPETALAGTPHPPPVASGTSVREALRAASRPQHQQLEDLLGLTGALTPGRYHAVLQGFAGFLDVWEPRVAAALPQRWQDAFARRRRGHLLHHDLQRLGVTPDSARQQQAAEAAARVPLDRLSQVFGSLYVLEGSTLGARVIVPHLQRQLNLTPETGAAYFHGHGDASGALWREFCMALEHEVGPGPVDRAAACTAACATFAALITVFSQLP
ncbi:biliverdin-producing heme oxygenase [Caldimonas brevitalea]|uniref:Bacteriophytochrome heme oxygenase BphO n=1 Tax=Caldimonas brevitalea TaxID=413882 RepID=A0A0G3BME2_9BURK|nr:biliverdin-producing heme oxygenase [Caldimonas brevitalea]AKJ29148.1 bacteriophytochrome heme oxygenase BphO [Caldimonas brevitalea]